MTGALPSPIKCFMCLEIDLYIVKPVLSGHSKTTKQYQTLLWTCVRSAHLQCVNNHYAKFEYKEMKTVGVTDYTNQTPSKHFWTEKCLSSTPLKIEKIFM